MTNFNNLNDFVKAYNEYDAIANTHQYFGGTEACEYEYSSFTNQEAFLVHRNADDELDENFEYSKLPLLFKVDSDENWDGTFNIKITAVEPIKVPSTAYGFVFLETPFILSGVEEDVVETITALVDNQYPYEDDGYNLLELYSLV